MTQKRFTLEKDYDCEGNWEYCYQDNETERRFNFADENCEEDFLNLVNYVINNLKNENEQLKNEIEKIAYANEDLLKEKRIWKQMSDEYTKLSYENEQLKKFENTGEHIRLSINIETGELQRHIYATGQWFGDFDRVLVKNWIDEDNYQRFIDRVIEVYNNEFKKELKNK